MFSFFLIMLGTPVNSNFQTVPCFSFTAFILVQRPRSPAARGRHATGEIKLMAPKNRKQKAALAVWYIDLLEFLFVVMPPFIPRRWIIPDVLGGNFTKCAYAMPCLTIHHSILARGRLPVERTNKIRNRGIISALSEDKKGIVGIPKRSRDHPMAEEAQFGFIWRGTIASNG